jgi:phosphinothricin acetyltransferase
MAAHEIATQDMYRESMGRIRVRPAELTDLPGIVAIYNHYIEHTAVTFDVEVYTPETRRPWFDQFSGIGRHRLLVAEDADRIVGYAGSFRHRPKAAYETSVEVTCYCAPTAVGSGIGSMLYGALFEALAGQDLHRALAGITEGNPRSIEFHRRFGFRDVGTFTEQGRKLGRYWDVHWLERPLP